MTKSHDSENRAAAALILRDPGRVFDHNESEAAIRRYRSGLIAISHGDTSTTLLQPLAEIGALCRKHDVLLYVNCTASSGGNSLEMDAWQIAPAAQPDGPLRRAGPGRCNFGRLLGSDWFRLVNRRSTA